MKETNLQVLMKQWTEFETLGSRTSLTSDRCFAAGSLSPE